ncbi:unnamed protein product [Diamesa serratosioi]
MIFTKSSGIHLANRNDSNVKAIFIHDAPTMYVPEFLGTLFNLTALQMNRIQLVEIKSQTFDGMADLEELNLSYNKLTSIPMSAFTGLPKLRLLYLISNEIEELRNGIFNNNINLEIIHLHSNKIKLLGSTLFDASIKLHTVKLETNVCVTREYKGAAALVELKNDIRLKCNIPNDMILSEIESVFTKGTNEIRNEMIQLQRKTLETSKVNKVNSKLEKENIELKHEMMQAFEQHIVDQNQYNQLKKKVLKSN